MNQNIYQTRTPKSSFSIVNHNKSKEIPCIIKLETFIENQENWLTFFYATSYRIQGQVDFWFVEQG